ncbi:hypothetical protein D9758_012164 [Tetrapyrgos nigripes]|uniref:Uncharacterized protein n=1 Tax=Tetrapyrgos nigripes TaxID=182062 RepID=A0A8H5FLN2_9AGAR|nr:hypothetical protein D9758_012164 [Tetrapyrgos nigripes]
MVRGVSISAMRGHDQGWIIRRQFSTSQAVRYRTRNAVVSSVTPNSLTSDDHLDLSGKKAANLWYRRTAHVYFHYDFADNFLPFPEKTSGFFYYHSPQNAPLFAGGMRFRVCPSNDPKTFQDGFDLLKRNGFPWEISNWRLALNKTSLALGKELVNSGTIQSNVLRLCRKLASQLSLHIAPHHVVYALKQPFPMTLGVTRYNNPVANETKMTRGYMRSRIVELLGTDVFNVKTGDVAHVCFDLEDGHPVIRLLSVPPEYVGKMKYKVGDTEKLSFNQGSGYSQAWDILKNSTYGHDVYG